MAAKEAIALLPQRRLGKASHGTRRKTLGQASEVEGKELVATAGRKGLVLPGWSSFPTSEQFPARIQGNQFP